jgi:DNA-binding HxlR family transcriptional regulator
MDVKEVILHLLENERQRKILIELYEGRLSFTKLKEVIDIKSNTTLARDLEFFNSVGLTVNVFERTEEGSYSHYELNHLGKRIAQIIIELEQEVDKKVKEIIPA